MGISEAPCSIEFLVPAQICFPFYTSVGNTAASLCLSMSIYKLAKCVYIPSLGGHGSRSKRGGFLMWRPCHRAIGCNKEPARSDKESPGYLLIEMLISSGMKLGDSLQINSGV